MCNTAMFECPELEELFEPTMYWHNPFNVLGLPVAASAKDIRRRREDVEAELFAKSSRLTCSALVPHRLVVDAALAESLFDGLKDPYRRAFNSLFWFWSIQGIGEKPDETIARIVTGRSEDRRIALATWYGYLSSSGIPALIARHNLAVYSHLIALILEDNYLNVGKVTADDCNRYWSEAIKFWDMLADDDDFWELFAQHLRSFDDPRMTTGFVRRFRHDLPLGLDLVNALLLRAYVKKLDAVNVARQIKYMKESQEGLDDVEGTLEPIVEEFERTKDNLIETIRSEVEESPRKGLELAAKVIDHGGKAAKVAESLAEGVIIKSSRVADDFAQLALTCQVVYAKETQDWDRCVKPLEDAFSLAEGESVRTRIQENIRIVRDNADQTKIDELYRSVGSYVWDAPEDVKKNPEQGLERAKYIVDHSAEYIAAATALWGRVLKFNHREFADRLALIVLTCLTAYCSVSKNIGECTDLLCRLESVAGTDEIRSRIRKACDALYECAVKCEVDDLLTSVVACVKKDPTQGIAQAKRIVQASSSLMGQVRKYMCDSECKVLFDNLVSALLFCIPGIKPKGMPFGSYDVMVLEPLMAWAKQSAAENPLRHKIQDRLRTLRFDIDLLRRCQGAYKRCWICKSETPDVSVGKVLSLWGDCVLTECDYDSRNFTGTCRIVRILVPQCRTCAEAYESKMKNCHEELINIRAELRELISKKFVWSRVEKQTRLRSLEDEINSRLKETMSFYNTFPVVTEYMKRNFYFLSRANFDGNVISSYVTTHPWTYYSYQIIGENELLGINVG